MGDVLIGLTQDLVYVVDSVDYPLVGEFRWYAQRDNDIFYACRHSPTIGGKRTVIRMHRLILGITDSKVLVDHRDGDGLNNRRGNLRIATHAQNMRNRRASGASRHKGVIRNGGRWIAQIKVNRKRIVLGRFADETDAARAHDLAAIKYHGEFARLNFPESDYA